MTTRTAILRSAAALMLTLAAGCTLTPQPTTVQMLDPRPETGAAPQREPAAWSLNIARPETDPTRDTNRVLVRTSSGQLQVHPSARWVAPVPELLRTLLVRHLRDRDLLTRVGANMVDAERTLAIDLRSFELAESGGTLVAEIRIDARLYDSASSELLGRQLFHARQPVRSDEPAAVMTGFETALAEILSGVDAWVVEPGADSAAAR